MLAAPGIPLVRIYILKSGTWEALSTPGSSYTPRRKKERYIMSKEDPEVNTETIAETENFLAWRAEEPDGEITYHIDIENVTVHFFKEEWEEFLDLIRSLL